MSEKFFKIHPYTTPFPAGINPLTDEDADVLLKIRLNCIKAYVEYITKIYRSGCKFSLTDALPPAYERWMKEHREETNFSRMILRLIQEKDMAPSAFYHAAGLDRKLFSRLKNEEGYQPSKDTAIRCCMALKLTYKQASHVLALAGYSLSFAIDKDITIGYCLDQGITNPMDVNQLLHALGQPLI